MAGGMQFAAARTAQLWRRPHAVRGRFCTRHSSQLPLVSPTAITRTRCRAWSQRSHTVANGELWNVRSIVALPRDDWDENKDGSRSALRTIFPAEFPHFHQGAFTQYVGHSGLIFSPITISGARSFSTISKPDRSSAASKHRHEQSGQPSSPSLRNNLGQQQTDGSPNVQKRKSVRPKPRTQEETLEVALQKAGEKPMKISDLKISKSALTSKVMTFVKSLPELVLKLLGKTLIGLKTLLTNPRRAVDWTMNLKESIMAEVRHYWLGTKLLYAEMRTATNVLKRLLHGHSLTRRERRQLKRTVTDLFRLVPFSVFIVIPFMEFLLPFALRIFPSMLPSTYQDSLKKEENMKKQLRVRIAMAEFLQDTVKDVAKVTEESESASKLQRESAKELIQFIERARRGERVTNDEIIRVAGYFSDELTLDNVSRPQLVSMCRYMGLKPFGTDAFLRYQLRSRIRRLMADDRDILWEGLDSLDKEELQQACAERGMRATGLTKAGYKRQMKQWLDLSVNKNVPASLLIMSRAFNITVEGEPEAALASSLSSMNSEVVNEVILETARASGEDEREFTKMKLESLRYQNELIEGEAKAREAAEVKATGSDSSDEKEKQKAKAEEADVSTSASAEISADEKQHKEQVAAESADLARETEEEQGRRKLEEFPEEEFLKAKPEEELKDGATATRDAAFSLNGRETAEGRNAEVDNQVDGKAKGRVDTSGHKVASTTLSEEEAGREGAEAKETSKKAQKSVDDEMVDEEESKEKRALTVEELAALESLVFASSVEKERQALLAIKQQRQDMDVGAMLAAGRVGSKTMKRRMKGLVAKRLDAMLHSLEKEVQMVDESIGNKLNLLDKDKDGVLSTDELTSAVKNFLRNHNTDESAAAVVQQIDRNKDGKVTIDELIMWMEERRDLLEVPKSEAAAEAEEDKKQ